MLVQTKQTLKTREYTDLDVSFMKHPVKKDVLLKNGDASIIQSLKCLVLTNFYERLFQPNIGCNVRKMLFENITPQTAITIKDLIKQTIENFEPRIKLTNIIVIALPDENRFEVQIYYFINNSAEPQFITFFLEKIR